MKPITVTYLFALTSFLGLQAQAADLSKLSRKLFIEIESELVKIETGEGAEAASGEIEVARQWIKDGQLFLKEGSLKKAAAIAERLPVQLELIRALVGAGIVVSKANEIEREIQKNSEELRTLKSRYDRLILMYHGKSATGAYPTMKEGSK